jgi:hypothetical protein
MARKQITVDMQTISYELLVLKGETCRKTGLLKFDVYHHE